MNCTIDRRRVRQAPPEANATNKTSLLVQPLQGALPPEVNIFDGY